MCHLYIELLFISSFIYMVSKSFWSSTIFFILSIFSTISLPECGASKLLERNQRNKNEKFRVIRSSSIRTINHIRIFSTYRIRLLFKRIKMRRQIDFQISVYLSVCFIFYWFVTFWAVLWYKACSHRSLFEKVIVVL